MPQTVEAIVEGEVGFGHLVVMARTADALAASPTARRLDEQRLLAKARENSSASSTTSAATSGMPPTPRVTRRARPSWSRTAACASALMRTAARSS